MSITSQVRCVGLAALMFACLAWANPPQTFSQGSLIIPMQSSYQTDCGIASAYGLVWKLLYENRTGGAFSGSPVTVYWAIQGAKHSPNRCVPTNKHTPPLPGAATAAGKLGWDSGPWNDGCDFSVENSGQQPVVPVDYALAFPPTGLYPSAPLTEFNTNSNARPSFDLGAPTPGKGTRPSVLDNSGVCPAVLPPSDAPPCGAARFTTAQYLGGAFIIDASDAQRVVEAMKNPAYPHLNMYTSDAAVRTAVCALPGTHKVYIHQATTSFDAPIYKRINKAPGRIAAQDPGTANLVDYLGSAGLTGSIAGLPAEGVPSLGSTGVVYDRLTRIDDFVASAGNPNGYINSTVAGGPRYRVLWTLHWDPGSESAAQRTEALANVAYFANQSGNGVMAQCSSIYMLERNSDLSTHFMFDGSMAVNGNISRYDDRNCTDPDYVSGTCMNFPEADDPFAQIGDFYFRHSMNGVVNWFGTNGSGVRKPGVKRLATSRSSSGASWPPVSGTVWVAISDGAGGYYIGGDFTAVGGVPRSNIAHLKGDGSLDLAWGPQVNGKVRALLLSPQSTLFVGGMFTSVNGVARANAASVTGPAGLLSLWNPDIAGTVSSIATFDGSTIYVGGSFSVVNAIHNSGVGISRLNAAAFDSGLGQAKAWNPSVGDSTIRNYVATMLVTSTVVYVGGLFSVVNGGLVRNRAAAFDAVSGVATPWNPDVAGNRVFSMLSSGNTIVLGGQFTSVGGDTRRGHLAVVDAVTGVPVFPFVSMSNLNTSISSLALSGNTLYMVGAIGDVNGIRRDTTAAIDVSTGSLLGWTIASGLRFSARAVAHSGSTVYVSGYDGVSDVTKVVDDVSGSLARASGSTVDNWDTAALVQKDNDPNKATILYLGAHEFSQRVAGTRLVLNTLLNLGADPISSDRAFAQPVAFVDNTAGNTPTLLSSAYKVLTGTLLPGTINFSASTGKNWLFPFAAGNLRGRNADTGVAAGVNELSSGLLWDADSQIPLPDERNLFTYFGGTNIANPSLTSSRRVKNDVAQLGWVPARIEHTELEPPNCVDVMKFGDFKDKVSGPNTAGLISGSDGVCDLQQSLQWSTFAFDVDSSGHHALPASQLAQYTAERSQLKQFVQLVRGYCFALDGNGAPRLNPSDAECTAYGSVGDNRAHLGGAVRSSAALAGPSIRIADSGAPRPTVAYVGTWDGQLHAIYVGGGGGYAGPIGGRQYLNPAANAAFKHNWAPSFAGNALPPKGKELWSFMPSSQLPWLKSNSARVDSTPVVHDAFVDLYGDGIRRWHTILVVSVGGTGRELFAFDVTNPLQPVLLWDIVGSNHQVGGFPDFASVARSDFGITGQASPLTWDNSKADYVLPPLADPGRGFGLAYDFSELGGSRALAIGQMREGLEPTYAVFVSSNSSGYGAGPPDAQGRSMAKGLVVHALDLGTGQKLWQWRQPYVVDGSAPGYRLADNTVPPPVTIRQGPDGVATVLVGDMEGRLWELDAARGLSLTAWRDGSCVTTACNFPAFDAKGTVAAPQPITSNIALAKLPATATGPTALYGNDQVALMGTAGTDWVPMGVAGQVHTLLLDSVRRKPVQAGGFHLDGSPWSVSDARSSAQSMVAGEFGGVLQEPTGLPLQLKGSNRVYGNITVTGQVAYVPLVSGQGGDPMSISAALPGKTLEINLGDAPANQAAAELPDFNLATFGGVAVFNLDRGGGDFQTLVIGDEVGKTTKFAPAASVPASNIRSPNKELSTNTSLPYRLYNVIRRFLSQQ